MYKLCLSAIIAALNSLAVASTFTPTRPPAVPLAVKSPYLNAWLQGDSGCILPGSWPRFWTGQILGWQGFVAVNGTVYNWMGAAPGPPNVTQTSLEYTSSRSIFTFDVNGQITMTVTFLSPVYPDDLSRQSQQFSYVSAKVKTADGASHSVQVYMDVTGEWTSGDLSQGIQWDTGSSGNVSYHKFFRANQSVFAEKNDMASWGTWYLSAESGSDLSWQIGRDTDVRGQFRDHQNLSNTKDTNFRAIDKLWPVFAFAHDLGTVNGDEIERVFSLGLTQDQVVSFTGSSGQLTPVPGLWTAFYQDDVAAMTGFFNDYTQAVSDSDQLDAQIQNDSVVAGGENYATITSLSLRQSFGGMQLGGTVDKPYIFLKEISSDGDTNTVDVIYPAYPMLLYLNAILGKYLLEPLYENQESGVYPNAYAEHDLGVFPVARGYASGNDERMPVEECGNMIIMSLAYAQRTDDTAFLSRHYAKLSGWAEYLRNFSLIPDNQLSTDDFAGTLANQTNLALKGIIGLRAMSEIANLTNNTDTYGTTALEYLQRWKALAINNATNPPHTTLDYGDQNSHGLLYNLYADRLLGLDFVDQSVYDMESSFYPTVALAYGVPLDSRHSWAKSDWQMWTAAFCSQSTRDLFIQDLASWIGNTTTTRAMTDLFDARTGHYPSNGVQFTARPVVGGVFSILALPT